MHKIPDFSLKSTKNKTKQKNRQTTLDLTVMHHCPNREEKECAAHKGRKSIMVLPKEEDTVGNAMPAKHKKMMEPRHDADEQVDREEDCDQVKGGESHHQEAAFGVLPNELVSYILCQHVKPTWQVVCKSVCQRWHLLLLNQRPPPPDYTAILAQKGCLGVLQWARSQGCPWDTWTCASAAKGGHLEVLQWARSQGCPRDMWTCASAAKGGHLEILQWARRHGCPWNKWTCASAAKGGHLEVLQWARSQGCPWDTWTCAKAAQGGHLEVLQWARSQGCPWDEDTCAYAAEGGHLEVLQWARSQGCPWDEQTCVNAAQEDHEEEVLQWASKPKLSLG